MAKSKRRRTIKPRVEKTVWSNDEMEILKKAREQWLELEGRDEKNEFCTRIGEEIRALVPEKYGHLAVQRNRQLKEDWERRLKAIKTWFNNHRGLTKQRRVFKFERKIQMRNVIAHYKRDEIEEEVRKICPDHKPGSQNYFRNYQKALAMVKESITDESELQFLEEKRKEWQSEGPPEDVQRKTAKKYGKRIILNMHEVAWKQMGMHAITIEAHRNEVGDLGLTFHDYNQDLAGPGFNFQSFLEYDKKACAAFSKAFGNWVLKILEVTEGHSDSQDQDQSLIVWETGPGGVPILPAPVLGRGNFEHLKTKRSIIRDFFRMHYRLASGKDRGHPPWEAMGMSPERFFNPGDIPNDFIFRDPTRMKGPAITELLQHLRNRQSQDTSPPFLFRQVLLDDKFVKASYPKEVESAVKNRPDEYEEEDEAEELLDDSEENTGTEMTPNNPTISLQAGRDHVECRQPAVQNSTSGINQNPGNTTAAITNPPPPESEGPSSSLAIQKSISGLNQDPGNSTTTFANPTDPESHFPSLENATNTQFTGNNLPQSLQPFNFPFSNSGYVNNHPAYFPNTGHGFQPNTSTYTYQPQGTNGTNSTSAYGANGGYSGMTYYSPSSHLSFSSTYQQYPYYHHIPPASHSSPWVFPDTLRPAGITSITASANQAPDANQPQLKLPQTSSVNGENTTADTTIPNDTLTPNDTAASNDTPTPNGVGNSTPIIEGPQGTRKTRAKRKADVTENMDEPLGQRRRSSRLER